MGRDGDLVKRKEGENSILIFLPKNSRPKSTTFAIHNTHKSAIIIMGKQNQ